MSYYRDNTMPKSNQFYNLNMNDMNMEEFNPNFSIPEQRRREVANSNRNIWDNSYQANSDWTRMDSRRPQKETFTPTNYTSINYSEFNSFPKMEENKNIPKMHRKLNSCDCHEKMIDHNNRNQNINFIVDSYFKNKTASESCENIWNQTPNYAPQMDYNISTRHNSLDNYHNTNYNMSKISSSPNNSGIFSNGSNSDDNNLTYYDNDFMAHKRNDSRDNQKTSFKKVSSSLFMNESEPKGEDFADLDELKNSTNMDLWDYAKTQKGSRNLQKLLNKLQPENIDILLDNFKNNFPEMMMDTYGNYFCQKLIQSCSADQRMFILKNIMNDFSEISCHNSGTHALQSMIEIINLAGEEELIKEAVKNHILKLSFDPNGTHVIQKIISSIKEPNREHINRTVLENMNKLINDSNGVCVLKKFVNGNKNYAYKSFIINEITANSLEIVQNPFGNYLIQHILDEWGQESSREIVDVIIGNIVSLSMQKFSSNVVEKCFDVIDMPTRRNMCMELFNPCKISSLLKNKYGNFVLQKAIQLMTVEEKMEIREILAKRVKYTSNKEKSRFKSLIEIIQSSQM